MKIQAKKEFKNFIFNVEIEESDYRYLKNNKDFIDRSINILIKLKKEVYSLENYLKNPVNYNKKYSKYKSEIKEQVFNIKNVFEKISNFYFSNYLFNKSKIKNQKMIYNQLEMTCNDLFLSDKNEVANSLKLNKFIDIFINHLNEYSDRLEDFILVLSRSTNSKYDFKLSKRINNSYFNLNSYDYISYKENNLEVDDWIKNQIDLKIKNMLKASKENLIQEINKNDNLGTILSKIKRSENFLEDLKKNEPLFILLKDSNLLNNYLDFKKILLSKLINKNYNDNLDLAYSKVQLKKNIDNTDYEGEISNFLNIKSEGSQIIKRTKDKVFFIKNNYLRAVFIKYFDQKDEKIKNFINSNKINRNNYLKNTVYQEYFTILKGENKKFHIVKVLDYSFTNKDLLIKLAKMA